MRSYCPIVHGIRDTAVFSTQYIWDVILSPLISDATYAPAPLRSAFGLAWHFAMPLFCCGRAPSRRLRGKQQKPACRYNNTKVGLPAQAKGGGRCLFCDKSAMKSAMDDPDLRGRVRKKLVMLRRGSEEIYQDALCIFTPDHKILAEHWCHDVRQDIPHCLCGFYNESATIARCVFCEIDSKSVDPQARKARQLAMLRKWRLKRMSWNAILRKLHVEDLMIMLMMKASLMASDPRVVSDEVWQPLDPRDAFLKIEEQVFDSTRFVRFKQKVLRDRWKLAYDDSCDRMRPMIDPLADPRGASRFSVL